MAKYTGADCRICRREQQKLFLKGDKCLSGKCPFDKRIHNNQAMLPGQHGGGRKKVTEYGTQLREKQKVKRAYGLLEKQFYGYYVEAARQKGVTGETMLILLERRLDNIVFRMRIGSSRSESRQLVSHGHITVNGKNVNIPSYQVNVGDVIEIKEGKRKNKFFSELKGAKIITPKWLEFDSTKLVGKVKALPVREDIDLTINEQLIVELYSK